MPNHHASNSFLVEVAKRVLSEAQGSGVTLRVLGGLGIYLECPEFQGFLDEHREPISDIDLIGLSSDIECIEEILVSLGYEQNESWRMLVGYQRRIFYTPEQITIEIYLDRLFLCQNIDLRSRLGVKTLSLSPTDLFLSRIQRVKLAPKDVLDLGVLLTAKNLGSDGPDTIDLKHISSLAATSWPWWTTLHDNLSFLLSSLPSGLGPEPLRSRLRALMEVIDQSPKTLGWHLRALVGSRLQWYADVE
jgi:hypothetical protein